MDEITFTSSSPYGDYQKGQTGVLAGFMHGGDGVPCAVVRTSDGHYVMAPLTNIIESSHYKNMKDIHETHIVQ